MKSEGSQVQSARSRLTGAADDWFWRHPLLRRSILRLRKPPVPRRLLNWHQQRSVSKGHDALVDSELLDRCWIFGGALLGWAREGSLLAHDLDDVDFGVRREHEQHVLDAIPRFRKHGFVLWRVYRSNDGRLQEVSLRRRSPIFSRLDFFLLDEVDGFWEYSVFGTNQGGRETEWLESRQRVSVQPLEWFEFMGHRWMKVADHEAELEEFYGNWRVPDENYSYMDSPAEFERRRWERRPETTL